MKIKNLLLTIAATLGMTALTMAQNVPNYVPTNGLVGWWPFNGNANDESGNGNNGTVNGATLATDRFGNAGQAYDFANANSISTSYSPTSIQTTSYSAWFLTTNGGCIIGSNASNSTPNLVLAIHTNTTGYEGTSLWVVDHANSSVGWQSTPPTNPLYIDGIWHHIVGVFSCPTGSIIQPTHLTLYVDGQVVSTILQNVNPPNSPINIFSNIVFGYNQRWVSQGFDGRFIGKIDDIGIWNRALTQQEITDLYNAVNCANNTAITPQTNTLTTGSAATFTANTSDPNPSYVWQSDFGQGFQTLNNFGNYSGTNTGSLNIANVQLPNHTQSIRVITTSGNCIDTSNVAIISIADTCINTITDTTLITVTDTLLINTTITGLNPPNNANTIKVFPNPTNDHITINYGNFSVMNGYQLKIENSLGQQVFQTDITQQSDYLNLSSWGVNGLYFVHIIDPQGNTIDIRKIVLQ
jgi:hypothetical protein